jgi:2TM family of unknown function (DUF5676)
MIMPADRSGNPALASEFRARREAPQLSIVAVGMSLSLFLVVSFVLCVALGIFFPAGQLHGAWLQFLPGFVWLTWQSFLFGLAESFAYGWYVAAVFVPIYNVISGR